MRLFHSPSSPFVRKVMVLLHETGQAGDVSLVPTQTTATDPDRQLMAKNPLGKLPALERAEGATLYDSRVICRYLDARKSAGLYPAAPRLWDSLTVEATADGLLDAAVAMVYEVRLRPPEGQSQAIIEAQWVKAASALDSLEARWISHLKGRMDIGHIAVGCALGYLDFRHPARDWRKDHAALAGWYEVFAARPSMLATQPPAA